MLKKHSKCRKICTGKKVCVNQINIYLIHCFGDKENGVRENGVKETGVKRN